MKSVKLLTMTALFTAVVCVTTAYLLHIPVGTAGGYIHLGDAFIYLAASVLPMPYAVTAAAVGSGLADLLAGAPHWIVFTILIKGLMATVFTASKETVLCVRNIVGGLLAGVICIVGYYIAEGILFGNWIAPLLSTLTGGFAQSGGGFLVYVLCGVCLDKARVKQRLLK